MNIIKCDFGNTMHADAVVMLMRAYMTDDMGGVPPLNDEQNKRLIEGLKNHPSCLSLLAVHHNKYIGLTNSFINFGTFAAKPFLNIHDVIVLSSARGIGAGKKLIEENIRIAKTELNCTKITLEVRNDNHLAQNLYQSLGFTESKPSMYFWTKTL